MPLSPAVRLPVLREVNRARSKLLGEARQGKARQGKARRQHRIFERRLQRSIAFLDTSRFPLRKRTRATYALLRKKKKKRGEKKEKERKKVSGKCHLRVFTIYHAGVFANSFDHRVIKYL
jgi:hypothetical protein